MTPYINLSGRDRDESWDDPSEPVECKECGIYLTDMDGWQQINRLCRHCGAQS